MENVIKMYTDGGSRGNPGPAGVGVWIETLDKKFGEYIGETTNNVAEYQALIVGLKKLKVLLGKNKTKQYEIECYLDSELVVKQLNHEYKLKDENVQKNFIEIWNLMLEFKNVIFIHIPREKNKIADAMVNEALDAREKQEPLIFTD
jgi:ribonuclease HI